MSKNFMMQDENVILKNRKLQTYLGLFLNMNKVLNIQNLKFQGSVILFLKPKGSDLQQTLFVLMEYTIFFFLAALQGVCDLSSQTRDQAHTPCIGVLTTGNAREAPWCAIFKLYLGLKKLISLQERKPCQVSMEERFSPRLLSCAMWSFPNITQQSGSNNENKYVKHLTQVVCNLCSSKSTNHLKNSLLNSSGYRLF